MAAQATARKDDRKVCWCINCNRQLLYRADLMGKKAKCPGCGALMTIPALAPPPPHGWHPLIPQAVSIPAEDATSARGRPACGTDTKTGDEPTTDAGANPEVTQQATASQPFASRQLLVCLIALVSFLLGCFVSSLYLIHVDLAFSTFVPSAETNGQPWATDSAQGEPSKGIDLTDTAPLTSQDRPGRHEVLQPHEDREPGSRKQVQLKEEPQLLEQVEPRDQRRHQGPTQLREQSQPQEQTHSPERTQPPMSPDTAEHHRSEDAQTLVLRGRDQLQARLLDDAVQSFTRSLGLSGNTASVVCDALWYRAATLLQLGQLEAAQADYNRLATFLAKDNGLSPVRVWQLGVACAQTSHHEQAMSCFDKAIRQGDNTLRVAAMVSRALTFEGVDPPRVTEGIDDYTHAIAVLPQCDSAFLGRGRLHALQGNAMEANRDALRSLELIGNETPVRQIAARIDGAAAQLGQLGSQFAEAASRLRMIGREVLPQQPIQMNPSSKLVLLEPSTGTRFQFVYVRPGRYKIGYSEEQRLAACRAARNVRFGYNASVVCDVSLLTGYFVLDREITVCQWNAVIQSCPGVESMARAVGREDGPEIPVNEVSWSEATLFCYLFSKHFDVRMRLPNEIEWECAARPSFRWVYPWGSSGEYKPPPYSAPRGVALDDPDRGPSGIYHFAGNLSEWCLDEYQNLIDGQQGTAIAWDPSTTRDPEIRGIFRPDGTIDVARLDADDSRKVARTIRGGAFDSPPYGCQLPVRNNRFHTDKLPTVGFRPILIPGQTKAGDHR